jgi:hypothetical protein
MHRDRWPLNNDQIEDKRHENKKLQNIHFLHPEAFSLPVSLSFPPSKDAMHKKSIEMRRFQFFCDGKKEILSFCHGPRHQVLLLIQSISATRIQFKITCNK